jgi:hypothetical protein
VGGAKIGACGFLENTRSENILMITGKCASLTKIDIKGVSKSKSCSFSLSLVPSSMECIVRRILQQKKRLFLQFTKSTITSELLIESVYNFGVS